MRVFAKINAIAERHGLNPRLFAFVYFVTIPPAILSGAWLVDGISEGIDNFSLLIRVTVTWLCVQAPSIYIMVWGRGLSYKIQALILLVMLSLGYSNFGIMGIGLVLCFLMLLTLSRAYSAGRKMPRVSIREFDPESAVRTIAARFRRDYSDSPWNERWRCPACIPEADFAGGGSPSERCEIHNVSVLPYWSDERTSEYIRQAKAEPNFRAVGAYDDSGELVGFTWAYLKPVGDYPAFYIDVIDLEPEFRVNRSDVHGVVLNLVAAWKLRYGLGTKSLADVCATVTGLPPVARLYSGVADLVPTGVDYIATRTHRDAIKVHRALRVAGFEPVGADARAPERVYFRRKLKSRH